MKYYVEIFKLDDGEVEIRMGPRDERMAEKLLRGAGINLNHDEYGVRMVPETECFS